MPISKIKFRYSWPYDKNMKELSKPYEHFGVKDYPSYEKTIKAIKFYEKAWSAYEKKILTEISKVSGLKWREDHVYCYVVGLAIPFSDPLTLPGYYSKERYVVDKLTHELIHQIQIQNEDEIALLYKWIYKKYSSETKLTRNHIVVHAIHAHIYLKFFDKLRLKDDIKFCSKYPDYKRAWEIVQQEGHENLIKEFRKRIK